jgi:DMSO/TMAO reductase YedYZ heme-binding membrane subunit
VNLILFTYYQESKICSILWLLVNVQHIQLLLPEFLDRLCLTAFSLVSLKHLSHYLPDYHQLKLDNSAGNAIGDARNILIGLMSIILDMALADHFFYRHQI